MGQQKWASDDDAGDLLAGILDETATEAEAEQQRIAAEMKAREDEERRLKEEEEARKRAEAEFRLSREKERLQEVEKRRSQKLEALRIEELKESGQWVPPEVETDDQPLTAPPTAVQPPPEARPQPAPQPVVAQAPPSKKSNVGYLIALVVLLLALGSAGFYAFVVLPDGYEVDSTTYAKTSIAPAEKAITVVELGFAPIPVKAPEPARTTRPRTRRSSQPASRSSTPRREESRSNSGGLDLDLDTDPFNASF